MDDEETSGQRFWNTYIRADGTWRRIPGSNEPKLPPGEELALLRRGLTRPAGDVLDLYRFYTCPVDDFAARRGELSVLQQSEHAALALYGLHQQSQNTPMHRSGVSLGRAMRALRTHERSSEQAVDNRFHQAFSSPSPAALQLRLRGLVSQLRGIGQPLDYDRLIDDLTSWHRPESRTRVRRRWGLDYYPRPAPQGAKSAAVQGGTPNGN